MKNFYTIGLILIALIISQQTFPQKENAKGALTGEQQIELSEGYSFISSRIIAENPNLQDILQNNLANLEFVRNSAGLMLRKIGPNWVNSIGDWVNTEGYLFKMSSGDDLIITGDVIDPQTPVELSIGYQIIGYLPDEALNTEDVFQDVLDNLEFVRNTAGLMLRKIGPNWVNSIGDMQPGEGYLVKMFADDVLIYPGSSSFICGVPFTDPRDGQSYNTVLIGERCWMAENMNIGTMINGSQNMSDDGVIEKYCYDNSTANCDERGGLYQWNEVMQYTTTPGVQGICPDGWYIPTDDELKILEGTVDSQYPAGDPIWNTSGYRGYDAGLNLKSTSGWPSGGNGSGLYGFELLPCGYRTDNGSFYDLTSYAPFWSSNEYDTDNAYYRNLNNYNDNVFRDKINKIYGFSVRCLKGDYTPVNLPPEPPSSPTPEDGTEDQPIDVDLSWTCTDPEGDPLTYDIYLGTETPPPLVITGQTQTTYNPGTLEYDKNHFWMIVAHDDHSNTTEGPVWSFSTVTHTPCPGIPTVTHGGQIYNTLLIGEQCWLKENLNVGTMINGNDTMKNNGIIEKYCYDNNTANCDIYGGLYHWDEIMEYSTTPGVKGICPPDWHIPTDDEWTALTDFLGGSSVAGGKMKETGTSHWWDPNTGATNESGFTALPGGSQYVYSDFSYMGGGCWIWSSSLMGSSGIYVILGYAGSQISIDSTSNDYRGFSVRCMRGVPPANQPPNPPELPIPEDGSVNQPIEPELSWDCTDPDGDPLTYDVYFGTVNPPPLVYSGQALTTYYPGILEYNTEYFWWIMAHDNHSNSTYGPDWSFTTSVQPCPGIPTVTYEGQVYNTILIGEHCWLKENLNVGTMINSSNDQTNNGIIEKYCYDNNTANCNEFGALYQWDEMMQYIPEPGMQGICPVGWHIPTNGEWTFLTEYLGGHNVAGGKMKETGTTHWNPPNLAATNESGFTALPGGYSMYINVFAELGNYAYFWSSSELSEDNAWSRVLCYSNAFITQGDYIRTDGQSVRCVKDGEFTCGYPFNDIRDGQVYNTILIGEQCWMEENLNIGTMISNIDDQTNNGIIEKYCYGSNSDNCDEYGGLYQWNEMMQYTTTPGMQGICPAGWHLPTDGEWTILTDFLGGNNVAGGKMKEMGTTHWNPPNTGATNESVFSGLPGGLRDNYCFYVNVGDYGYWWSSSESSSADAWKLMLSYDNAEASRFNHYKERGVSVRCLRDF